MRFGQLSLQSSSVDVGPFCHLASTEEMPVGRKGVQLLSVQFNVQADKIVPTQSPVDSTFMIHEMEKKKKKKKVE